MSCRVLFISGSFGLGHVNRDLAIANEMRRICPEIEIQWLAGSPASEVLETAGEAFAPEQAAYRGETELADSTSHNGQLSLTAYVFRAMISWMHNAHVSAIAASRDRYDVIVGDETYEILIANLLGFYRLPPIPFIVLYDFLGMDVVSKNVFEKLGAWMINLLWSNAWRVTTRGQNAAVFIGEREDVADRSFGWLLSNRRQNADKTIEFVGYAFPFDKKDIPPRDVLRRELGYGKEPLVICTVGGTSVGRDLLELCGQTFPLVAARVPGVHLILVAGHGSIRNRWPFRRKSTAEEWCPACGGTWLLVIWQSSRVVVCQHSKLRYCGCLSCSSLSKTRLNSRLPLQTVWPGTKPECACRSPIQVPNNWPTLLLPISASRSLIQRFQLMEHTWQPGGYWNALESVTSNKIIDYSLCNGTSL